MNLRCHIPWICWELLFSMFFMLCMDKGISLNLNLTISSNYVVFMIMIISIYVCMYVCMPFSYRVVRDYDFFMLMFICMYVCRYLTWSSRIILVEEQLLMKLNGMKRSLEL